MSVKPAPHVQQAREAQFALLLQIPERALHALQDLPLTLSQQLVPANRALNVQ